MKYHYINYVKNTEYPFYQRVNHINKTIKYPHILFCSIKESNVIRNNSEFIPWIENNLKNKCISSLRQIIQYPQTKTYTYKYYAHITDTKLKYLFGFETYNDALMFKLKFNG